MKKSQLDYELTVARIDIRHLRAEVSDWAKRYDIQNAALVDRDAKIRVLINALSLATQSAAQNAAQETEA
jgi:hypothetical protein